MSNLAVIFLEIARTGVTWLYCKVCQKQTAHKAYFYTNARGDQCQECGDVHNLRERGK